MGKSNQEIAEIAANWWGKVTQNPKFDNGLPQDGIACVFDPVLANMAVKEISPEVEDGFVEDLAKAIEKALVSSKGRELTFGTDYYPDRFLADIAKETGVPEENFPWKTEMWIDTNSITVTYGYTAPPKVLYANKTHWREKIQSAENAIKEYQAGRFEWLTEEQNAERIKCFEEDIEEYKGMMERAEE